MLLHARMPLTAMLARATRGGPVRLIDHGQSAGHDHSLGVTTKAVVPSMAAATPCETDTSISLPAERLSLTRSTWGQPV